MASSLTMTSSRSVAGAQYMNKKQSRLIFFIKKLRFSKFVLGLLNLSVRTYVSVTMDVMTMMMMARR
jgi:hypothetical protein